MVICLLHYLQCCFVEAGRFQQFLVVCMPAVCMTMRHFLLVGPSLLFFTFIAHLQTKKLLLYKITINCEVNLFCWLFSSSIFRMPCLSLDLLRCKMLEDFQVMYSDNLCIIFFIICEIQVVTSIVSLKSKLSTCKHLDCREKKGL